MRHLITAVCLLAAVAADLAGMAAGAALLLFVGALLEGVFWMRLLVVRRRS